MKCFTNNIASMVNKFSVGQIVHATGSLYTGYGIIKKVVLGNDPTVSVLFPKKTSGRSRQIKYNANDLAAGKLRLVGSDENHGLGSDPMSPFPFAGDHDIDLTVCPHCGANMTDKRTVVWTEILDDCISLGRKCTNCGKTWTDICDDDGISTEIDG